MPDIIKTESTLVEEDILLIPESLRFENEPWTRFYMAGEIIRELQKVSGKQGKYASEGNTAGECKTVGCGSAPASSSLPTELVNGKTSRRHWPSRTRISSPSSAFPRALLSDATRYPRIGGRQHWVASCFDRERYCTSHS
jgi:hypothetical protein